MFTCSGAALDATDSVALTLPATVGANSTGTTQLAPGARLAPQLLAPSVTLVAPLTVIEVRFSATLPLLASVTFCVAAAVAMVWLPNAMTDGVAVNAGAGAAALPDKPTTALPLDALEASVKLALNAPALVGAASTVTLQLAPAATGVDTAQLPPSVKMAALAPPTLIALNVNGACPLLLTLSVCGADGVFTQRAEVDAAGRQRD